MNIKNNGITSNFVKLLIVSSVFLTQIMANQAENKSKYMKINCMGCHDLTKYTVKELKVKLKKFQQGKGTVIMLNILNGVSDKDIDYLANKYGKKQSKTK